MEKEVTQISFSMLSIFLVDESHGNRRTTDIACKNPIFSLDLMVFLLCLIGFVH